MKLILIVFLSLLTFVSFAKTDTPGTDSNQPVFNKQDPEAANSAGSGYLSSTERANVFVAKDMVLKAAEFWQRNGKETAIDVFMDPDSQFFYKDLYLFVFDMDGKTIVHGEDPTLIGKNQYDLKDSKGNYFVRDFIELMQKTDSGWIEYYWKNYNTFETERKLSYLKRVGNYFIGCGAYKGD
jgi:cytochrome c